MKWRIPATATAFATVAALSVVAAPAAFAAANCDEEWQSTAIADSILVPAGATCVLGAVTVEGDVIVEEDGWLDATSATITGDVIATDAYGVLIDGTSVGGDVVAYTENDREGFLYLNDLEIGGSVEAGGLDLEISDVSIEGSLSSSGSNYVDVLRTTVAGDASVSGTPFGVSVQGAIITGNLTVADTARHLLIGAQADGSKDAFGNAIGGDLVISGTTAAGQLAGTTVGGALRLDGNTPALNVGESVTAGSVEGDYTGTAPGGPAEGDQSVAVVVRGADAGELSWSLEGSSSLVDLGVAEDRGDHLGAEGEIVPVRVTDTRAGMPEWSVTAQLSDFMAGGETIDAKYLGWNPYLVEDGGSAVAGAAVASGFDRGDGLAISRTLGQAAGGHDQGSAVLGADLGLKLPLDTERGTYTATLTLTALG